MAIYIKYEGIDGDATHADHKKWLDVGSLQWGVGRAISTPAGSSANREASEPSISEVSFTKEMDGSSPHFMIEACVGDKGKKCEIHLVSTGSPGRTYATYVLTNTLVSGYSMSTGGDRPAESITLNFTKVEYKYIPSGEGNDLGSPIAVGYDLSTTKKV